MNDYLVLREQARVDPEWAVIAKIWSEFNTPYGPDARMNMLTPGQRAVYALTWIRSEVGNGGFDQCFFNSTAYLLPDAIEGARALGSDAWVSLLERAAALFEAPYPRNRALRQQLLDQFTTAQQETMNALDDELYDLDAASTTSLTALFRAYIDEHPDEFFREPASDEQAVEALLDGARSIINSPYQRNLDLARELLNEAVARSQAHGLDRTERLAASLLAQLPDLTA